MTAPGDDRDLREWFDALRDHDARRTPAFGPLLADARGRRRPARATVRRLAWASGLAVVAVAAVLVLRPVSLGLTDEEALSIAQELSSWSAPTDAFPSLVGVTIARDIPGLELTSVPLPEDSTPEAAPSPVPLSQ